MAKVDIKGYETKQNRKKLINAFSDKSPVCGIKYIPEESDILLIGDNQKVLGVNTASIPLKATKNTQGVQVLTLRKKDAKMVGVKTLDDGYVFDIKKYITKNIPAAGTVLKGDDKKENQISLF